MLVGSSSPKEIGKKYVGPMMDAKNQRWVENVPYVILEQVSEEEIKVMLSTTLLISVRLRLLS